MPTYLSAAIGAVIRWALMLVLGPLVAKGILTDGQTSDLVIGLTGSAIVLLWSLYQKYGAQWWAMLALQQPAGTTPTELSVKVENGMVDGPTVKKVVTSVILLAVALGATGCALHGKSPQRQIATIGIQVVAGLDATGKTASDLHASKVITDAQYEAFLLKLKIVYQQAHRLGDALAAYNAAAGPDTASQVKAALDALAVLVPNLVSEIGGPGGAKIAELVGQVNQLILNIAAGLSPQAHLVALEPEVSVG